MKTTSFIYFDLKSKVAVINIMSTQVTYEREITLYLSDVKYAQVFYLFYCNLKDHIRKK